MKNMKSALENCIKNYHLGRGKSSILLSQMRNEMSDHKTDDLPP